MATILLSAVGAAVGAGFGGTVLGLSGAVIGRAVGATLGRVIDQRILGAGSDAVEVGRVDRFRLMGASEGAAVAQVWGRTRLAGQVIWATRFVEDVTKSGGSKGAPQPKTVSYSYSVSLAIALCEGEILRVGRIWADGMEIAPKRLNLRVYTGSEDQLPDPVIVAVEGADKAPAYRGIAYVVIEDLALADFGNRVPQFNFEVFRSAQGPLAEAQTSLTDAVTAVAMIPGTGEYALATTPVHYTDGPGQNRSANVNSALEVTDFAASLVQLREELPKCRSVSLVVSWFGDDLRCGTCQVSPKVEQRLADGVKMPWRAGGIDRTGADELARMDGRSIFGGTPADASVIEAIKAIRAGGQEVMFYPFVLMKQLVGNTLPDPWTGGESQPALPWRGRITLAQAPGRAGSSDRSAAAEHEVGAFFGTATAADIVILGDRVVHSGSDEWRYRRFILHYARLCMLAGGVDAFCIGSELRGLTQIRGQGDSFPAVDALRTLAADVRAILGPETKISYAADWSEYAGFQEDGNRYFHLDPLWADANIDFVGIDNYMPLSDWRDGEDHADAGWGSVYSLEYLKANIAGGEGFDWYYDGPEGEAAQYRKPIVDDVHDEPWVWRVKDLRSWWGLPHHERIGGSRNSTPTAWQPGSKPIRFTEYGCPSVDKGTNQPNLFCDARSSESAVPRASTGRRDDLIQMQYLRAMADYWTDPAHNPNSDVYAGQMVDFGRAHVWAWDARPFPLFPALSDVWGDGANYRLGHWLNGRVTSQPLAAVVAELAEGAGVTAINTDRLYGLVRGYSTSDVRTARSALQPLMLMGGFDTVERDGQLVFLSRDGRITQDIDPATMAVSGDAEGLFEVVRSSAAEVSGQVRLGYTEAEGDYLQRVADAQFPDDLGLGVVQSDLALVLTASEGRAMAERWLAEARVGRDTARFALPRSALQVGAGDVVRIKGRRYRIDRTDQGDAQQIEAVRIEPGIYQPSDAAEDAILARRFAAPVPVFPLFLDLPLLKGNEVAHAPYLAVTAKPWPGRVGVWSADLDDGYELNSIVAAPSVIGVTQSPLFAAKPGLWDRGTPLRVRIYGGNLSSALPFSTLNGANVAAIGDGSSGNWEVFQFADAALVEPNTYELSMRLRGQAGTDGIMPQVWPSGSYIVLMTAAVGQIDLDMSARGLARNYRIGAAARGYDDPSVEVRTEAFDGIGLRPYPVAHLSAKATASGTQVTWLRRTRIDGDNWTPADVPLGEDAESYAIRVIRDGAILREATTQAPVWTYPHADFTSDGAGPRSIHVAQVSSRFGPGPFRSVALP
jgi:GTA TIM-barrel-like domain/Putative phage tail protein